MRRATSYFLGHDGLLMVALAYAVVVRLITSQTIPYLGQILGASVLVSGLYVVMNRDAGWQGQLGRYVIMLVLCGVLIILS